MSTESSQQKWNRKETAMAFNMGLQNALYILEKTEELSLEDRRLLIEELRRQMAESEKIPRHNAGGCDSKLHIKISKDLIT